MKNLTNKTDFVNDRKKEIKSPSNFESRNLKNTIVCMGGTCIFTVLTIIFPLFRVFGGFLTYSGFDEMFGSMKMVFYWDQITFIDYMGQTGNNNYLEFSEWEPSTELIWQIIHLLGPIWIIVGLIGAGFVVLPAFQKLLRQKPVEVAKIGLILGLVATGVEYGLFILAWVFSNNTFGFYLSNTRNLYINFPFFGCFVIGWVGLIVGYVFATKE